MTQSEKLQKVIERAVKNGWKPAEKELSFSKFEEVEWTGDLKFIIWEKNGYKQSLGDENFIYSHDFCKAYFPNTSTVCQVCGELSITRAGCEHANASYIMQWKYHLQQLALTPPSERIDYLFSFLNHDLK